jgi:DNA polymerase-3 subunit gamma/tau
VASQSLYRKYRPQFFRDVVGQEHVRQALLHSLRDGSVRHAYLFSGPRGTGKTTTARLLAKALNCLSPEPDGEPCGACVNCESIAAGTFPDLVELDAASNNRVEEMRDLIERVHFGLSSTGRRKVYIVDEVHMLTTSSSNALLKTLEEPPDHVVFVLATTDPNKVLPTIRSRTQHFEVNLLDTEQLGALARDVLAKEGATADDAVIDAVVRRGAGSARDMLSALDQALAVGAEAQTDGSLVIDADRVLAAFGGTDFERRVAVLDAVAADDPAGALVALHESLQHGTAPRELAEELLETLRDAFVQSAGHGRVPYGGPSEERERLTQLADQAGLARLTRGIETLGDAIADMRGQGAPDPRLVLEVAIVRLARRDAAGNVDALRERIERLEARLTALGDTPSSSPAPTSRLAAPSSPAPSSSSPAALQSSGAKPALGAVVRDRPAPPPRPAPAEPEPAPASASMQPIDFDEVIVAWKDTLDGLKRVVSASVQQANPIGLDGDVVLFGVPPGQLTAVQRQFKNNADEIRALLEQRLGTRVRFKLVAHDFDAPGALRPQVSTEPPPDLEPHDDDEAVDPTELVDAPRGAFEHDDVSLLQAELGAQVVEEPPGA